MNFVEMLGIFLMSIVRLWHMNQIEVYIYIYIYIFMKRYYSNGEVIFLKRNHQPGHRFIVITNTTTWDV